MHLALLLLAPAHLALLLLVPALALNLRPLVPNGRRPLLCSRRSVLQRAGPLGGGPDADTLDTWLGDVYDRVDYVEAMERAFGPADDNAADDDDAYEMDEDLSATADNADRAEGLTYGEMSTAHFLDVLDALLAADPAAAQFVDVGSGRGQLVLAAAFAAPPGRLVRCVGVEVLPELHEIAAAAVSLATPAVPCAVGKGDVYSGGLRAATGGEASVALCNAQVFSDLDALTAALRAARCSVVASVNRELPSLGHPLAEIRGLNHETGGESVTRLYRM